MCYKNVVVHSAMLLLLNYDKKTIEQKLSLRAFFHSPLQLLLTDEAITCFVYRCNAKNFPFWWNFVFPNTEIEQIMK